MMADHVLFLMLLLAIWILSVSGDVFVSIDCGASGDYTDENSITWRGDSNLIENGFARAVQSNNSVSHVMDTLRVFATHKKNCYSIKAEKGGKVLVRASFNYGNYDNKSTPPTFDLLLDGNLWITVVTSSTQLLTYEATYIVKGDFISVCVAQTNLSQFPFISAIEVRSLDMQMYGHVDVNHALFLIERIAYAVNETIRFPADPYDRIWVPAILGDGLFNATNDESINVDVQDKPPEVVLKTATMTQNRSMMLTLGLDIPDEALGNPVYINWYFSEVRELNSSENRVFRIYRDNQPFSLPIVPPYGSVSEYYVSNHTVTSNTNFSLVATGASTLPPLINALEAFSISDALANGTDTNDVDGLVLLQNKFKVLRQWGGDPCLPVQYSWEWLNCSTSATPRVTSLDLGSFGLSGSFPNISSMDALETIDLHNNSLSGPIPEFFGTLPSLNQLNLADNLFSGPIPTSLSKLNLIVAGNPSLCTSGKACLVSSSDSSRSSKKKSSKLPVILGTTIPVFFIFCVMVGAFVVLRRRSKAGMAAGQRRGPSSNQQPTGQDQKIGEESAGTSEQFYGSPSPLLVNGSGQT